MVRLKANQQFSTGFNNGKLTGSRRSSPSKFSSGAPRASFSGRPKNSFTGTKAKSKICAPPTCPPGYNVKTKPNSIGGCPLVQCVKQKTTQHKKCPKPNCSTFQRVSYSGKKLANGCQEFSCVDPPKPRSRPRQMGQCPVVSDCGGPLPDKYGYCVVSRVIRIPGRTCRVCPVLKKCNRPKKTVCPDLRRCRKANANFNECAIPNKHLNTNGCEECPIITTRGCNQVGIGSGLNG